MRTKDGGRTWVEDMPRRGLRLYDIDFLDPRHGWLDGFRCVRAAPRATGAYRKSWCHEGSWVILRTADGGRRWQVISMPRGLAEGLNFVTPAVGFAHDGDALYRTTDGGVTWRSVPGTA